MTMRFRTVAACDAKRPFSALLGAVEQRGETIDITRRGKPVARLIPEPVESSAAAAKTARIRDVLDRFSRPMSGTTLDREALYEDDSPGTPRRAFSFKTRS